MSFKPKILIVRQLALGDVLLATPIIKQLYLDHSGDCEIDVLTRKPEAFINNPYINEVISPEGYLSFQKNYNKTINLDLAYENYPNMHILEAYAKYSHGSIKKILDQQIGIFTTTANEYSINNFIVDNFKKKYVVIHMRKDTWPSRNLRESTWREIVDGLLKETNVEIAQVGSEHEISFNHNERLINCLNKFTIQELKLLISKSVCYIGVDSGTLHVAASTNIPIVSVFTSAHHDFRKPLGRKDTDIFIPITPEIECYGCQSRLQPPITGVICSVGDPFSPPCKDSIPVIKIIKNVIANIN